MSVTKEELQKVSDLLSKKIDDRHDKIIEKWDDLTKSFSIMNVSIGKFIVKLDHQDDADRRLNEDISKLQEKQGEMSDDIIKLITNQENTKTFFDRFGVPIMLSAFFGLSAINYFGVK